MQQMNPCPSCGFPNDFNQRFCGNCGIQLATGCPYCGVTLTSTSNFCSYCGNLIAGSGPRYAQQGWLGSFNSRTLLEPRFLAIYLFIVLIGMGIFIYYQFFTSPGDITPPVISNVVITSKTKSSVLILWQTNEAASSQIEYGRSKLLGSFYPQYPMNDPTTGTSGGVYSHSVMLMRLNEGTTYYYRVISKDAAGNEAISTGYNSFKTKVTPPFVIPE